MRIQKNTQKNSDQDKGLCFATLSALSKKATWQKKTDKQY